MTDVDSARRIADEADHKKLESLMEELRQAIDKSQALKPFKDQLLLDITPEGLRIQIVDQQNRPMFDLGSAKLKDYTNDILKTLAGYLNTVPNRISLTGHTDIRPYPGGVNYTNWELSADRANSARRALESGGIAPEKIARVVGLASSVLFDKDNPQNPINRRISIIVMTKAAEDTALKTESRPETPTATAAGSGSGSSAAAHRCRRRRRTAGHPHRRRTSHRQWFRQHCARRQLIRRRRTTCSRWRRPPIRGTEAPVAPSEGTPG